MKNQTALSRLIAAALAVAAFAPVAAQADEGKLLVRVRAVNIDPANKDNTGLDLNVNKKLVPELDISYFITPNIAAELILTYPQKHNIRAGSTYIGSLRHLPPTLSAQYHFLPESNTVRPYVGAGVNYTNFSSVNLPAAYDVQRGSFGLSIQAGADFPVTKNISVNVDVKKVQIRADVISTATDTKAGTLKVDPTLIGVGVGYRF